MARISMGKEERRENWQRELGYTGWVAPREGKLCTGAGLGVQGTWGGEKGQKAMLGVFELYNEYLWKGLRSAWDLRWNHRDMSVESHVSSARSKENNFSWWMGNTFLRNAGFKYPTEVCGLAWVETKLVISGHMTSWDLTHGTLWDR